MDQPKKILKKEDSELRITAKELRQNKIVTEKSRTPEYKEFQKKQGVDVNSDTGKSKPIIIKRRIDVAEKGSGKNTIVFAKDGKTIIKEIDPRDRTHNEQLAKIKRMDDFENKKRENKSNISNYQTGDREGNPYYDKKKLAQDKDDKKKGLL